MQLKSLLGKQIKKLRESRALSQEAFAERIGVQRNTLARIENGKCFLKASTLTFIKQELGISYKELFAFDEDITPDMDKALYIRLKQLNDTDKQYFIKNIDAYLIAKKENKKVKQGGT